MSPAIRVSAAVLWPELGFEEGVSLSIRDGILESVGKGGYGLDFRGLIALPLFTNAHIHMMDWVIQQAGWDLDIDSLVGEPYGIKYVLLRRAPDDTVREGIETVRRYLIRQGVGAIIEFREFGVRGTRIDCRRRHKHHIVLTMPTHHDERAVEEVEEALACADGVAVSSPHYFPEDVLRSILSLAKARGLMTASHVAEVPETREAGDLERLLGAGGADVLVHGTYLSEDDLSTIASRGSLLVLCPRANRWFLGGEPPAYEALRAGVDLGVGTDNAGWVKPDVWREAEVLHLILRSKGVSSPEPVLRALIGPSRLAGLEPFAAGSTASFMLVSAEGVGARWSRNPLLSLIKNGGPEHVMAVVIDGRLEYCELPEALCAGLRDVLRGR